MVTEALYVSYYAEEIYRDQNMSLFLMRIKNKIDYN